MPQPVQVTDHVAKALARVTSRYQKPKILALVAALTRPKQELENVLFVLLGAMNVDDATGDLLTKIGRIVGEERAGRSDAELRPAVRLRIRVNRSRGRSVDIVDISRLAAAVNATTPAYYEHYPAGWHVEIANLAGALEVAKLLGEAKAAGSGGHLVYTPDADQYFVWGYDGDAVHATEELWSDVPNSDPPNYWAASLAVPSP